MQCTMTYCLDHEQAIELDIALKLYQQPCLSIVRSFHRVRSLTSAALRTLTPGLNTVSHVLNL